MTVAADIQRIQLHLTQRTAQLLTLIVAETDAQLKMRTPVDTGRARASWAIGVNQVNPTVAPDTVRGQPVVSADPQVPAVTIGSVVYITNSLPYARRLEYGQSKQAPNGMVRLTAAEMPARIAQLTRQVAGGS
jgi:hypothetical protein